MAEDTKYSPKPFLYKSRGLAARWEYDRVPEGYYVSFMNALEREEESLSSRFGYTLLNRDPNGTPSGQNYYFSAPVVSLAKLNFQNNPQRFAVLGDGSLWQRNANTQGPYTELTLPETAQGQQVQLSGEPLQSVVQPCYETALPFLFLYDEQASIKIAAGSSTPELTGIDPPPYTLNVLPYSPLLTLIDNFSASNSYTVSGFDDGEPWAFASVTGITATSGEMVTDFPQFIATSAPYTATGETVNESLSQPGIVSVVASSGAFPSLSIETYQTVTVTLNVGGALNLGGTSDGTGTILFQYSVNGGGSWITFYSYSWSSSTPGYPSLIQDAVTFTVTGLTNLDQLELRAVAGLDYSSGFDGIVLPGGQVASIGSDTSVDYPVAFPSGTPISIAAIANYPVGDTGYFSTIEGSESGAGFSLHANNVSPMPASWIAAAYVGGGDSGTNANGSWSVNPEYGNIIQFGYVDSVGSNTAITFPIPFPDGTPIVVVPIADYPEGDTGYITVVEGSKTNTGCSLHANNVSPMPCYWIAVGYTGGGNSGSNANGYWSGQTPSGMMLQWGSVASVGSDTSVAFPAAFSMSASIDVVAGVNYPVGDSGWVSLVESSTSTTGFSLHANNVSPTPADWIAVGYVASGTATLYAEIGTTTASVNEAGIFGEVCNGIISVLNENSLSSIPIASITAANLSGGVYEVLEVETQVPHGLSASDAVSIYATSNDLVDGFYSATVVNSTTFTVPYETTLPLSATGGVVNTYFSGVPSTCVLTDEYSTPYPTQFSAWGFYQAVPISITSFPIGCWSGKVDTNTTASVGVTANFDLSQNNQVTDEDLIVLTLQVGSPANIASIQLQFDVNNSEYTSSYYQATISSAYYQNSVSLAEQSDAYDATQNQILADALGLLSGQPVGSTTAQLQPSNYSTGSVNPLLGPAGGSWQAIKIPRGNFLPVGSAGQSGLDWTNITGWRLVITTTATAITGDGSSTVACNGLYLQWGYGPSSFAGVGYNWRYTYYNANTGTESSPSPICEFNETYGYLASLAAPFFFRQAAQCQGYYSNDSQVTHVRLYRQGGILAQNWVQTSQWPNVTGGGQFYLKDVISDQFILQAPPLVLDNDPPVTSSLVTPIQTTLSAATTGPGQSIYSTFASQSISVTQVNAVFVPNQIVEVGNANNLEVVSVITGGTGTFTAILRLQHNAGEQVNVYAVPRVACNLCMVANLPGGATQVVLAGDPNNPARVYYAKPNQPESFGPENYIDSGPADDPVMALINWRGVAYVVTQGTWHVFVGGAKPYLQPTGAAHGIVASQGWTLSEGEIWFRASDGFRAFSGADGKYMTLPVEWIFRGNPECLPPQANASEYAQDVFAYFNNDVIGSYISLSGERYRLIWSTVYSRYRQDDIAATAMLWEKDTNQLVVGIPIGASEYAVALDQQYSQDYDDGGWSGGSLVQTPIMLTEQTPFRDLGAPHFPKQWNVLETDCNTQGQNLETTLVFNTEPQTSIVLPAINSGSVRQKIQQQIEGGDGYQAYAMSIQHTMAVTVAPTLFQENIYAAILADYRSSFDTYWQKASSDRLKLWKQAYVDYSGDQAVTFYLYINGDMTHWYFSFTLPAQANRSVVRTLFPAMKTRLWRMVGVSSGNFQLWAAISLENKQLEDASGYSETQFGVYE